MLRNIELDYVQPYQLGDLGENIFKKLFKSKALRKVGAVTAGIVSLGIIKPKVLGVKNAKSLKYFKVGKIVGIAGAVVTGAFLAGPSVMGFMRVTGSKVFGVLTKTFMAKGLTAQAAGLAAQKVMNGAAPVPPEAQSQIEQMALQYDQTAEAALGAQTGPMGYGIGPQNSIYGSSQAGMFGFGGGEIPWGTIAIGVVAVGAILFMTSGPKSQYIQVKRIRRNPGAMWHKKMRDLANELERKSKRPMERAYHEGQWTAQRLSYEEALNLGINPKHRRK